MRFFLLPIICGLLFFNNVFAGALVIPPSSDITNVSINPPSGNLTTLPDTLGFPILKTLKVILMGLLVIYMVYNGFEMMLAMGANEDRLKRAKRQIWYSILGIVFINIPGALFSAFIHVDPVTIGPVTSISGPSTTNIFFDLTNFGGTLNGSIIGFLQIAIFWIAIFVLVVSGIKMILGGRDTKVDIEGKKKILYSVIVLILVGFIEVWKNLAYGGNIPDGVGIFSTAANLVLFFAGPIAIFYLTLAAYYYITSAGNDEKIKKAKSIITYVVLGTLIFLASYTFLKELNGISL